MSDISYVFGLTAAAMGVLEAGGGRIGRGFLFVACGAALLVWSYVRDTSS